MAFSKNLVSTYMNWVRTVLGNSAADLLTSSIEKQKQSLFADKDAIQESKTFIKTAWELVIIAMVLYFVVTFFNAVVRNYL